MKRHLDEKFKMILSILKDGEYHSGQEIANTLHVSRTSIAKYIHTLQNLGLDIYTIKGRGYAVPYNIDLLDEELINKECGGAAIKTFDMIDSTNRYMMTYLDEFHQGSCILAETQTMGVGRSNTSWISPFGAQLILSMYWNCDKSTSMAGLSLAVGLATIKTLEYFGVKDIGLKWPNDIYSNQKKLAGILVESKASILYGFQIVIGVGINLINTKVMESNHLESIGLESLTDHHISKNELAISLIKEYRKTLTYFEQNGFNNMRPEWNSRDIYKNYKVRLIDKHTNTLITEGIERGVNENGSILIENSRGILEAFHIGDMSLRR